MKNNPNYNEVWCQFLKWAVIFGLLACLIIFATSCQSHKQWIKKGEREKWLKDSIITKIDSVKGQTNFIHDTALIDRIVNQIVLNDTCLPKEKVKEVIKKVLDSVACKIDPVIIDSELVEGKIWTEGGKLFYEVRNKPQTIKCPECLECKLNWWDRNKFWIGFILGMAALWVLDRIITKLFGKI